MTMTKSDYQPVVEIRRLGWRCYYGARYLLAIFAIYLTFLAVSVVSDDIRATKVELKRIDLCANLAPYAYLPELTECLKVAR